MNSPAFAFTPRARDTQAGRRWRPSTRPIATTGAYLGLACALLAVGLPTWWIIVGALKTTNEIYLVPSTWTPRDPQWRNFLAAWHAAPFFAMFVNSLAVTVAGTVAKLANAIFCAYAFAFIPIPGRNVAFFFVLGALMIPEEVTILPNYLTVAALGYVNTVPGLVLPTIGSAFATFFLRQAFLSLPREVIDAAKVDGAGHLATLWHVVLPLARPVLATLVLLTAVARWNDFLWPLVATSRATTRTLPVGVYFLYSQEGTAQWGVVLAGTIIVIVPILALFLVVQRHLVEGIASGAVKG